MFLVDFFIKWLGLNKDVKPSDELVSCASFLGLNPVDVIVKARFFMLLSLVTSSVVIMLLSNNVLFTLVGVLVSLVVYYYFTEKPKWVFKEERLKALGFAPEIVTVFGTSLMLNPSLERGFKLVSDSCVGRVSDDFRSAYKNSILLGEPLVDALNRIAITWGEFSDGFRRGLHMISTGLKGDLSVIDKGMNIFFNGVTNDLRRYLGKIKTHTLVLFSFGTIMPLIIISMLPVIAILDGSSNPLLIAGFLVVNLLLLNQYASYILAKRPLTFSQVSTKPLRKGFIRFKSFEVPGIPYALIVFFVISSPSLIHFFTGGLGGLFPLPDNLSTVPLVIGLCVSLSLYYQGKSGSLMAKRSRAVKCEKELLDITYSIGSVIQDKRSFEDALRVVISGNKGKLLAGYLRNAYNNIKELSVSNEKAVISELVKTNSKRVLSVFNLIFMGLKQGITNGAENIFRIYEHFNRMYTCEEESRALLEQVLSMMSVTVLVFAPLISAFIVIMQNLIEVNVSDMSSYGVSFINTSTSIELMILMLGFYVSGLVFILTRYQVLLRSGPDDVLVSHELSRNFLVSTSVFLATLFLGLVIF